MRQALLATALVLFGSLNAHAMSYPTGNAILSKTLALPDGNGNTINMTSGPVSIKIGGRPLFWGPDTLQIKTIQGTISVKIPKSAYTGSFDFTLPAGDLPYALKGSSSDQVTKADARDVVQQCSVSAVQLAVRDNSNQPVMEHVKDDQGNALPDRPLVINLCASSTNGQINITETLSAWNGCSGTQHVQMQQQTTTSVYTIEIIDPATGSSVGKIEAKQQPSTDDVKVKDLTSCQ